MSVVIRLSRKGTRKQPAYRVVAATKTKPRDGLFLEVLGTYNPKDPANKINLQKERYDFWLKQGAKPSKVISDLVKKLS